MNTFAARYHGRCQACPAPVQPGDEVAFTSDGALIHVDCEDTSHTATSARRHPVCTVCWLEHPAKGECP